VKSNTEAFENERWPLVFAAGFRESRGSSASRDCFREDEMPDREDVEEEEVLGPGELEARLANSRESRACGWRLEWNRDMLYRSSHGHALWDEMGLVLWPLISL
jgi:hypothetical protein